VLTAQLMREVFGVEPRIEPHPVTGWPMCIPPGKPGAVSTQVCPLTL
jgi:hypothetical protein